MRAPRKAAITGWPVDQSRSPLVHEFWLKKYNISGFYEKLAVAPEDAARFYRDFADSGLAGCNVTVPHKETAAAACDWLDPAATAMGAANTLWLDDQGQLCGSNTDGIGFLANLDQQAPDWDCSKRSAIVLGAGGAARAVIWSVLERGFERVWIFNRTLEKAQILADQFGPKTKVRPWEKLEEYLGRTDLLVNATALGMVGKSALEIDLTPLSATAIVTDIVYVPLETDLLKQARQRGNRTVDGLGMLLHQAVPGFERWFGVRPEVDEALRNIIVANLDLAP